MKEDIFMSSIPVEKYRKYLGKLNNNLTNEQVVKIVEQLKEFIDIAWELKK